MSLNLFAYWPRAATLPIARYVIRRLDVEIDTSEQVREIADERVAALLDVLTQKHPDLAADLKTLVDAGNDQGYDNAQTERLESFKSQFIGCLPADVRAQL